MSGGGAENRYSTTPTTMKNGKDWYRKYKSGNDYNSDIAKDIAMASIITSAIDSSSTDSFSSTDSTDYSGGGGDTSGGGASGTW